MARIGAHGQIIGTLETVSGAFRYMSDGAVLRNKGFGWKLAKRNTKYAGLSPVEMYAHAKAKLEAVYTAQPMLKAWRDAVHNVASLNKRWRVVQAVQMHPEDPDAVWSELTDALVPQDRVAVTHDDCVGLCRAYRAAQAEKGGTP
jgi:hypothetical protein